MDLNFVLTLSKTKPAKNIIHTFLSYDLIEVDILALSHGLDQHIPDRYKIKTDFEYFHQNILNYISDLNKVNQK